MAIIDGEPQGIFASHVDPGAVSIDAGVELVPAAYGAYTQNMVEVYVDPAGVVHVANPTAVQ
ncbi:hypothetical protein [Nocardioides sp.]|uniref:hypothetical protein n=1 Tax=Nocardioides sp. TaxID=35761 RepID=UPI002F422943